MRIPLSIIKSWTKFKGTPDELKSLIDLHITEVEEVIESGKFSHMVVGEIIEILPHPNADKLQITKTKVGDHTLQIVCGAQNIVVGQKVPVALPGSMVASGVEIKEANIRGEDSFGMLCSGAELGIEADVDGIMILDKDSEIGTPLGQIFDESGDVAFDLKVLANRPDYMSWLTIAREISASQGNEFMYQLPVDFSESRKFSISSLLTVKNSAPKLCNRYMARVVKNVKVESSPTWLKSVIQSIGLRSINNIVDAANLAMFETGQPLHVFDLAKIHRGAITVRMAKSGEVVNGLDEQSRKLSTEDIVITDAKKVLAVAGIIGGVESAVSDATIDIVIESANFNRKAIRMTSRRLGVRTDASARFERGVDLNLASMAMARFLNLIQTLSVGTLVAKGAIDLHVELPAKQRELTFGLDRIKLLIDLPFSNSQIVKILTNLNLRAVIEGKNLKVTIPSDRGDVMSEADIAEELIRIEGLDKIVSRLPMIQMTDTQIPQMMRFTNRVSDLLTRMHFIEVKLHPFFAPPATVLARSSSAGERRGNLAQSAIAIENPLTENWTHLKDSLIHGLIPLETLATDAQIFEINKVFIKTKELLPQEITQLAGRVNGPYAYAVARSVVSTLLAELGIVDDYRELPEANGLEIVVNQQPVGQIFQDTNPAAGFVIDLDKIIDLVVWTKPMTELPKYPVVKFDLAFEINDGVRVGSMHDTICATNPLIAEVQLFDVFQLSDAKRSVAFHLTLRSQERTLTKEDREAVQSAVIERLTKQFQATLRG